LNEKISFLNQIKENNKNKILELEDLNKKQINLSNNYKSEINNTKKILEEYKIGICKYESEIELKNKIILELQCEKNNLNLIFNRENESNNLKLSKILEENNNLKKSMILITSENQKYKIENSRLIELNNSLNFKIQIMLNSNKSLSHNKSFKSLKKEEQKNNSNENFFNIKSKTNWMKTFNNFNIEKTIKNNENYFNSSNSFDNLSLMNKKIDNLNKKNKEIFNIIYKCSEYNKNNEEKQ